MLLLRFASWSDAADTCTTFVRDYNYPIKNAVMTSNVALSPDGKYFAEAQSDGPVRIWSIANGGEAATFSEYIQWVNAIDFSSDGKHLLIGASDGKFRILLWNLESDTVERAYIGHTKGIRFALLTPDDQYVFAGGLDTTVYLWNRETGELLKTFYAYYVNSIAVAPDGRSVLAGFYDLALKAHIVRMWDISTGESVRTFSGHRTYVTAIALSPDGQLMLTGDDDNTARLWNVATGDSIRTFTGHKGTVMSVQFSPDGNYILTGSDDKTARLWNAATGEHIRTFMIPEDDRSAIISVHFLPDGQHVLTGSDARVALWNTDGTTPAAIVKPVVAPSRAITLRTQNRSDLYIVTDGMQTCGHILDLFKPDGRSFISVSISTTGKTTAKVHLDHPPARGVYYWKISDNRTKAAAGSGSVVLQ